MEKERAVSIKRLSWPSSKLGKTRLHLSWESFWRTTLSVICSWSHLVSITNYKCAPPCCSANGSIRGVTIFYSWFLWILLFPGLPSSSDRLSLDQGTHQSHDTSLRAPIPDHQQVYEGKQSHGTVLSKVNQRPVSPKTIVHSRSRMIPRWRWSVVPCSSTFTSRVTRSVLRWIAPLAYHRTSFQLWRVEMESYPNSRLRLKVR